MEKLQSCRPILIAAEQKSNAVHRALAEKIGRIPAEVLLEGNVGKGAALSRQFEPKCPNKL